MAAKNTGTASALAEAFAALSVEGKPVTVRTLREQAAGRRPQRSGEVVHVPRSTSVVMWSPRTARERKRARGRGNGQD